MARLNIFVSFEFERDNNLKNSFYVQARDQTQHRVRNCSLNREYPDEAWKNRAGQASAMPNVGISSMAWKASTTRSYELSRI